MKTRSQRFLDLADEYRTEFNQCKWWQRRKKINAYANWQSALELAIKYDKADELLKQLETKQP